jgi:hypothetical protein
MRKRFTEYDRGALDPANLVACGADLPAANRIYDSFAGDKGHAISNMIQEAKAANWSEALPQTKQAGGDIAGLVVCYMGSAA